MAEALVRQLLDAYLSSQEETIFGDFPESLAIHVCDCAFKGRKSSTEGIDLEFDRAGARYLISVKSGPNWGNSSQIKKMRDNFRQARRILGTRKHAIAVNGCCYGREVSDHGDYQKICGQAFWELISGDSQLYVEIVDPLGHDARQRNEAFGKEYAKVVNQFTREFINEFCSADGAIDWSKLVVFNSGTAP